MENPNIFYYFSIGNISWDSKSAECQKQFPAIDYSRITVKKSMFNEVFIKKKIGLIDDKPDI